MTPEVARALNAELSTKFVSLEGEQCEGLIVDRPRQRLAAARHASQSESNAVLARRLDLSGATERVRLLLQPIDPAPPGSGNTAER